MTISGLADKVSAIVYRDVLTAARYRSGLLITAAGAVLELAAFYFLAAAIGPGFRPEGVDYFPFLLVGTGFYTFLLMGIHSFLEAVQEAQQTGTLEVLFTASTPAPVLVLLSALSAFSRSVVQLLFYLGAGLLLFHVTLPAPNITGCVTVFCLSLLIALALGMMAAALQIAALRGSAILWFLGSGAWFMTGTLFPVGSLPKPLRFLSELIPITHSLDGMRLAFLQGAGFSSLVREIGVLTGFVLFLLPLSFLMFAGAVRRARQEGTLSCY